MTANVIEHYGPEGRILRFSNQPDLYPVNRYQSLILGSCAVTEAMAYAARRQRELQDLRALEVCCGGGPAAICLKSAGVGYVEASDINPRAVAACKDNAALNQLSLDAVTERNLLGPAQSTPRLRFDLIACNPPCGDSESARHANNKDLRQAIDGGEGGVEPLIRLMQQTTGHLVDGGRFVFVMTSTMSFNRIFSILDGLSWHFVAPTPIAQPFSKVDSVRGNHLLAQAERGEVFAWEVAGWIWRLTWVVSCAASNPVSYESNMALAQRQWPEIWFRPTTYDVRDKSYMEILRQVTYSSGLPRS